MKNKNLIKLEGFVVLVFILINCVITTSWAITETAVDAANAVDTCVVNPGIRVDSVKFISKYPLTQEVLEVLSELKIEWEVLT